MAVLKTWNATALTGGAIRALDAIPVASLADLHRAFVVASDTIYYYEFDAAGTAAESSPSVIRPDDYTTAGNWILSRWYTQETNFNNNLFINSDFAVNQEAYAGGVITTGEYGHDMMKSISSASYTVSGGALTMVSGTLGQRNDELIAADGETVTVSVESGSLTIGATAGAASTVITVGNPFSWTFDESGSAFFTITAAVAAKGIKIELGSAADGYVEPESRTEAERCKFYLRDYGDLIAAGAPGASSTDTTYFSIEGQMRDAITATGSFTAYSHNDSEAGTVIASISVDINSILLLCSHTAFADSTSRTINFSPLKLDARY